MMTTTPSTKQTAFSDGLHPASSDWKNWSGDQRATPSQKLLPDSEDMLCQQVKAADQLRVVGAGHSFAPLVPTNGALLSLDKLSGLVSHDEANCQARLWAGTRLFNAGPLLHDLGQAMPNLGDINRQSLAGAISTATHGTGVTLPCIAAGAEGLRLITANGEAVECSRDKDSDLFNAAAVSLGMLGVITQVNLQNIPSYRLRERVFVSSLDDVLPRLDAYVAEHRHFEIWAFPHSRKAIVKTLDLTDELPTKKDHGADSDDLGLYVGCEAMRLFPAAGRGVQKILDKIVRPSERTNWSHNIFASHRGIRFNEMEYQVPRQSGVACLDEVCQAIARDKTPVFFPVEFRYVAPDDYWLSPFNGKPGDERCSISVHQYWKQDYRPLFSMTEAILQRHQGRPHWGKLHTMEFDQLKAHYPHLPRFLKLRAELDPTGKFLTPYLKQLFNIGNA